MIPIVFLTCFLADEERSCAHQVDRRSAEDEPQDPKEDRQSNDDALAAFVARKAEIDAMLTRLQALSDDHFNYSPDEIDWGHVGTLGYYAELLKRVTDSAFNEGEHAE
jgi:hypothetical protein